MSDVKTIRSAKMIARQDHDCFDCAEGIKAGQQYERASCAVGGRMFTRKRCMACLSEIAMFDEIAARMTKVAEGSNGEGRKP